MDSRQGRKAQRLPRRKHLRRLDEIYPAYRSPVFFITVCTYRRKPVLAAARLAGIIVDALRKAPSDHGWVVGRYVVMPDHIHFFCGPAGDGARKLSSFVGFWKRSTGMAIRKSGEAGFRWQSGFFDRLLRREDSYEQKWEYVRANPLRAGLIAPSGHWPYEGELCLLRW